MRPTLNGNPELLTCKIARRVEGVLQVTVRAAYTVVNVEVEAGLVRHEQSESAVRHAT